MGMYLNYQAYKWTSSSHEDALKLLSPQVDEFIIRSTSGRVHPMRMPFKLPSPQLDEFIPWGYIKIIKFISGRVHY